MEEDGAVACTTYFLMPSDRVLPRVHISLASQAKVFRRTVDDCTVHFLSSIYTGFTPCWSSWRGLNVLRLRQAYVHKVGPLPHIGYPIEIINPW
jgi:hypothetical protein